MSINLLRQHRCGPLSRHSFAHAVYRLATKRPFPLAKKVSVDIWKRSLKPVLWNNGRGTISPLKGPIDLLFWLGLFDIKRLLVWGTGNQKISWCEFPSPYAGPKHWLSNPKRDPRKKSGSNMHPISVSIHTFRVIFLFYVSCLPVFNSLSTGVVNGVYLAYIKYFATISLQGHIIN